MKDAGFAKRLSQACDRNELVLPTSVIMQYGTQRGGYVELAVEPRTGHYVVEGQKLTRLQGFNEIMPA